MDKYCVERFLSETVCKKIFISYNYFTKKTGIYASNA